MPGTSGTPGAVGKVRAVPCGYIQLFGLSFGSWDVFAQSVVLDFLFCKKSDLFKELPGKKLGVFRFRHFFSQAAPSTTRLLRPLIFDAALTLVSSYTKMLIIIFFFEISNV